MTFAKVQQSGWDRGQDVELLKLLKDQDKKDADARKQQDDKKKTPVSKENG